MCIFLLVFFCSFYVHESWYNVNIKFLFVKLQVRQPFLHPWSELGRKGQNARWPRWHIVSSPIRLSASDHGSKNRGGSTSVRGRVLSPHISSGRRWLSCRQPACRLPRQLRDGTDRQTNGEKDGRVALFQNAPQGGCIMTASALEENTWWTDRQRETEQASVKNGDEN